MPVTPFTRENIALMLWDDFEDSIMESKDISPRDIAELIVELEDFMDMLCDLPDVREFLK